MTTSPPSASDVVPASQPRRRRGGSLVPRLSRPTGATTRPGGIVETTVQAAGAIVLEAAA
ncbi:aldo/keto reductase, partial [Clavibacter michiganensis]